MDKIKVAICYDFDKTLSTDDMQAFSFMESIKMNPSDFWKECGKFGEENNANGILSYLYKMLEKCKQNNIKPTKEFFLGCGKSIRFFNGVETWFKRINEFGAQKGIDIEHYVISSGVKEIVEGTAISKEFKEIYACSYAYDENVRR